MFKKLYLLFFVAVVVLLSNCVPSNKNSSTFFGGKIINPKTDNVILFTNEIAIDTFFLDDENKFIGEIKNVEEGLYYFVHGNENQYIYLEPKDSLLIRLNTWDFDESLVFSGKGGDRNNILIDCFLENEKDDKLFYQYNKLSPQDFENKVDSLKEVKINTLNQYLETHPNETDGFAKILTVALTYPLYARVEKYPVVHSNYKGKEHFVKLDASFYDHRDNVEFNNNSLMYYPPYSYFIRNYLYNKAYSKGHKLNTKNYTPEFTIDLLNIVDKEIDSEITKDAFLKQTIVTHFYSKSSNELDSNVFDTYFKLTSSKEDKKQIENLINDTKAIKIGEEIADFELFDYSDVPHSIKEVIKDRNVVLFFWNPKNVSEWYIKSRMEYLENTYENIDFIQIKINGDLKNKIDNLDIKNQYYLNPESEAHRFLMSTMPRSVLINKEGKVVNGYASISAHNLISYLEQLNN